MNEGVSKEGNGKMAKIQNYGLNPIALILESMPKIACSLF